MTWPTKFFQWVAPFGDTALAAPFSPHIATAKGGVLEPSLWRNIRQQAQSTEKVQQKKQELIRRWDSERELLYDDNIHVEASAYAHWIDLLISTFYYKYLR